MLKITNDVRRVLMAQNLGHDFLENPWVPRMGPLGSQYHYGISSQLVPVSADNTATHPWSLPFSHSESSRPSSKVLLRPWCPTVLSSWNSHLLLHYHLLPPLILWRPMCWALHLPPPSHSGTPFSVNRLGLDSGSTAEYAPQMLTLLPNTVASVWCHSSNGHSWI